MLLSELLPNARIEQDVDVLGITVDSRQARKHHLFLAVPGTQTDGRRYMQAAAAKGAVIAYEPSLCSHDTPDNAIPIDNLQQKISSIAATFYGNPSKRLTLIGITGTNGKTSTTHYVAQLLTLLGLRCAVLGTVGNGIYPVLEATALTTLDPINLQKTLAEFARLGATHCVMEVSSHALEQGRVNAVEFDVGVFTNLSRDHLDYHKNMDAYAEAKKKLFTDFNLAVAVMNADDPVTQDYLSGLPLTTKTLTTGIKSPADFQAVDLEYHASGFQGHFHIDQRYEAFKANVFGECNVYNLLTSVAIASALEMNLDRIIKALPALQSVSGRLQCFLLPNKPRVMVDFAHTPAALSQVLQALKVHRLGARIFCVFGCGGGRDSGKRPLMAAAAEKGSDKVIVTSDNPRHESPEAIINDILGGFSDQNEVIVQPDRQKAIEWAIKSASPEDVVLIAGKGHEGMQLVGDQSLPFSDIETAKAYLL